MIRVYMVFVAMLGAAVGAAPALAERLNPETEWRKPENARLLPQYCQDRLDPQGRWLRWKDHFGPAYIHMHHYCGGVYAELKAKTTFEAKVRKVWLSATVGEMKYVERYCDRSCVLFNDLHRRLAWALGQQGKTAEAMKHLQLITGAGRAAPYSGTAPAPAASPADNPAAAPPS